MLAKRPPLSLSQVQTFGGTYSGEELIVSDFVGWDAPQRELWRVRHPCRRTEGITTPHPRRLRHRNACSGGMFRLGRVTRAPICPMPCLLDEPQRKVAAMRSLSSHSESHLIERIGWLRAAVLGANDGIVSTASLIVGVAAAAAKPSDILLTGIAGLVAGAMSMAAGEYVSVSSQSDTETGRSRPRAPGARGELELRARGTGADLRQARRRSRGWRGRWPSR